jgi:hypothetical protein
MEERCVSGAPSAISPEDLRKSQAKKARLGGSIQVIRSAETLDVDVDNYVAAKRTPIIHNSAALELERWQLCPRGEAMATPSEDLIWVDDLNDLALELELRYPAPKGFSYVHKSNPRECSVHGKLRSKNYEADPEEILAAIREGYDLDHVRVRAGKALLLAGYDEEEVHYLQYQSRMKLIPLLDDMVLDRGSGSSSKNVIRQDKDDYQKAVKSLEYSRSRRRTAKDGNVIPRPTIVTQAQIRSLYGSMYWELHKKLKMPNWICHNGHDSFKSASCHILMTTVKWWVDVLNNHQYRRLPAYRNIIITWADPRNQQRTRGDCGKLGEYAHDTTTFDKFLKWLDGELAYCQKRKWKFAQDPAVKTKAKKKGRK